MTNRQIWSTCEGCGARLADKRRKRGARFCGDDCRRSHEERQWRAANPDVQKRCAVCAGELPFAKLRRRAKFCKPECAAADHKARWRVRNPEITDLPTGTVAIAAELFVATCFLKNGFDVFRAMSPSAACQLIVERGDDRYRVQVRIGYRRSDGTVHAERTKPGADLLAIVSRDDFSIRFEPDITVDGKTT